jgi:hypothetical protein
MDPTPHKPACASEAAARGPGSPSAQAAAAAILALSRAARSFVLYDPSNALVRQFLEEYQAKARAALDAHGEMVLEVRPFEMLAAGEVVYRDADREKSLAFKLFRDGVRRLTLSPSVTWPELLELLKTFAASPSSPSRASRRPRRTPSPSSTNWSSEHATSSHRPAVTRRSRSSPLPARSSTARSRRSSWHPWQPRRARMPQPTWLSRSSRT